MKLRKKISVSFCVIIVMSLLLVSDSLQALETNYIRVSNPKIQVSSRKVLVDLIIRADHLPLGTAESLALELTIEGKSSQYKKVLPPVIYTGKQRYMFDRRSKAVAGEPELKPYYVHKGKITNGMAPLRYKVEVPYEKWMKGGRLKLQLIYHDCCDRNLLEQKVFPLAVTRSAPVVIPDPVPVVEEPKREPIIHTAMVSAYMNFEVAKHDILPYYKNNPYELRKVDSLLRKVMYDKNIEIKNIVVTGYASPEGTYESNERLSQRRAEEFRRYVQNHYNIPYYMLRTEWVAEDWMGLERLVLESDIPGKYDALNIIRSSLPYDERDQRLKQLHGGNVYPYLLNQLYPRLRRIEVRAEYTLLIEN